jgi:hypothetical protein
MTTRASLLAAVSLFAAVAVPACSAKVALDNRPCPCASGWTCCETQSVCVAPGAICPGTSNDAGSSDASTDASPPVNPMQLASAQSARCMITDHDYLYWENANGLLVRVAKTGGALHPGGPQTPDADNPRCGLALDDRHLYATAYGYGAIMKTSVDDTNSYGQWGATDEVMLGLSGPSSIATDADAIYITEDIAGNVRRVPKSGTVADGQILASGLSHPDYVAVDDTWVYWMNRGQRDTDAGASDASGDAGAPAPRTILRVAKTGGSVQELASMSFGPEPILSHGLTLAGGRLFWTEWNEGHVVGVDVDGKNLGVLADSEDFPQSIVTDGTNLYWLGLGVRQMPVAGGPASSTKYDRVMDGTLAVDDTRVYWASGDEIWAGTK